jgi:hypothetical protein
MRKVIFSFLDRLVLTPLELVETAKVVLPVFGVLFIVNLLSKRQFGIYDVGLYLGAKFAGAFITPLLLSFVPGIQ